MKEIRLHGRGGQGAVKASQVVVRAAVAGGINGQSIPSFGVERKGSPVYVYLRLSEEPIRRKMQVYEPEILIILDDTLVSLPQTYDGLKEGGIIVINTTKSIEELNVPAETCMVATVDATGLSEKAIGKNIPNTAMLGAFAKATGLVDSELLFAEINATFGAANEQIAREAFDQVVCTSLKGGQDE